jgi:hypothetical protein
MAEDGRRPPRNKDELLARIEPSWRELQRFLAETDASTLTESRDAEGWSVQDHLSHIAAWERSVLFLLRGRPRHEGLGVDEDLYLHGGFDEINAAIHEQTKSRSLDETLTDLRWTHEQFLEQLDRLSDAELQQPYAHFLPDEPGEDSGEPVLTKLAGNTYEHYDEHREWMEAIAAHQG